MTNSTHVVVVNMTIETDIESENEIIDRVQEAIRSTSDINVHSSTVKIVTLFKAKD